MNKLFGSFKFLKTLEPQQHLRQNSLLSESFAYNTASNVVQFTDCNGSKFINTWDPMSRKTNTTIAPASGIGIIQTTLNNARTHSAVQYNSVPNPAWGTLSSDRLGYDGGGRLIAKRYLSGGINSSTFAYNNTTPVVGNTTALDPVGNKYYERALHAENRSFLYQPVDNTGNIASPVPGFDSVDRLLQYQRGTLSSTGGYEGNGGGSVSAMIILYGAFIRETWTLDGLGNWRSNFIMPYGEPPGTVVGSYNKLNQAYGFKYDGQVGASNGNLVNDGYGNEYSFDVFNRLIQVNNSSTGSVLGSYVYDAFNRRIRKTVSASGLLNGTTDYIWMGWQVAEERNSSNAPIRQYIWGTYIDECIQLATYTILGSQNLPAGTYYLLQDLLYRAVALTNSSGSIMETYDTDAYGNTLVFTGPGADGIWFTSDDVQSSYGANEIIYCGYRYDPETELYYLRNRSYNATLGRWLQRDPIGYQGGINLYEYVGGGAATGIDPTGKFCCSDQWSQGACPRFLRITYRKRSCLYAGSGASGIEQGLKDFDKYFYRPGTILKWPFEPDIMPGVLIGAITRAGEGISNRLEPTTGRVFWHAGHHKSLLWQGASKAGAPILKLAMAERCLCGSAFYGLLSWLPLSPPQHWLPSRCGARTSVKNSIGGLISAQMRSSMAWVYGSPSVV